MNISIYFDPTANKTFKNAIQNALSQFVAKTETEFILQTMMTQLGSTTSDESNPPFEDINFININVILIFGCQFFQDWGYYFARAAP